MKSCEKFGKITKKFDALRRSWPTIVSREAYLVAEILRLRCVSLRMTNGRFKEVFRPLVFPYLVR